MSLIELHQSLLRNHEVPLTAVKRELPVIAMEKWTSDVNKKELTKAFNFTSNESRNAFLTSILQYELDAGHNAKMIVSDLRVILSLTTTGVDRITELDKEYAKFADTVFKETLYNQAL